MIPVSIELKNVIEIPGVSLSDIYTINPLTMIINRPRVNKIAGSDNIITNGFRTLFIIENTSPAKRKPTMPTLT